MNEPRLEGKGLPAPTTMLRTSDFEPIESEMVNVTEKVPTELYACVVVLPEPVVPSPKDQE